MAIIRSYNQPTVENRPLPNVPLQTGAVAPPVAADAQARDTMAAAGFLEKAANSVERVALEEMRDANDARVQELANGFISGQQFTLYTDKDAFYRKKGQDAINGAQAATDKLIQLKNESLGMAANPYQRKALSRMLDAQLTEATNGISRHVAVQSQEWQKQTALARQSLNRNQASLEWNDIGKIEVLAKANEDAALEVARLMGAAPDSDIAKSLAASARSDIFSASIQQHLQNDQKRAALALYDRVKGQLDEKDNVRLAAALKSTAIDVEAEDWIIRNTPNQTRQESRRFWEAKGYSPEAASALAGHEGAESGGNPKAVNPKDGRDGSDSIGIFQWNSDRSKGLLKFAREKGLDPYERKTQLEWAAHELETTEADAGRRLKGAKSLEEANQAVFSYLRPAKQTGRMDLTQAAFNGGVGVDKANAQGLIMAAQNDPGVSRETKAAITTKLQRESAALEAQRAAGLKAVTDQWQALTQAIMLSPDSVPKGALAPVADGFRQYGDQSMFVNASTIAGMEETLRNFASAPKTAQDESLRTVAAALLDGKSKALADSLIKLNTKDRADAVKQAGEEFAALKTAASNGVRMETLTQKATSAVDLAIRSNDFAKAREIGDWFDAQVAAQAAGQAPAPQLAAAIGEIKSRIEAGEQGNAAIVRLDAMENVRRQQAAAFAKDALAAGSTIYSRDLGPLPPATDFAGRVAYAEQVSQRQGGIMVLPFTDPEIAQIRTRLETSAPEDQAKTMQALAQLPARLVPGVAAALAGKGEGDRLSRSYAAALAFYGDNSPASREIGNQILQGARIIKEGGDGARKPAVTSDAWQTALQDRIGNLFRDADPRMLGTVADAIASVYVWQMNRAGKQGEKTDTDVLNAAIKAVVGEPVERNGQMFLPPVRGMDAYQVDKALRSLSDGDLDGLRTMEGDAVTADVIQRRGVLTNGRNGEGWYFVRIPDPRAGGDLRPVVNADGSLYQLDLRPLIERAARFPEGLAPTPDAVSRARRRAPSSPTEGLSP